ncbi:hypothetical protein CEUSTIGMA_g7347.t1 [Chlamydomonas eustigma]|uniref:Uncharacterized protein n=1 Tax=Chlamydomonas eustigma TaxID=1157962 RepID=A0A250XA12_9CHLO|nr:hypothetical protein CEUSTIGMA_g7347.t1 [Chlamydomonas eustigma]|eukprot:GAX79907.1 hypothetical protein CEUSTIGMA_g7347.t1 [Chlamydomonas eustigma]
MFFISLVTSYCYTRHDVAQVELGAAAYRDQQRELDRLRGEAEALICNKESESSHLGLQLQQAVSKLARKEADCNLSQVSALRCAQKLQREAMEEHSQCVQKQIVDAETLTEALNKAVERMDIAEQGKGQADLKMLDLKSRVQDLEQQLQRGKELQSDMQKQLEEKHKTISGLVQERQTLIENLGRSEILLSEATSVQELQRTRIFSLQHDIMRCEEHPKASSKRPQQTQQEVQGHRDDDQFEACMVPVLPHVFPVQETEMNAYDERKVGSETHVHSCWTAVQAVRSQSTVGITAHAGLAEDTAQPADKDGVAELDSTPIHNTSVGLSRLTQAAPLEPLASFHCLSDCTNLISIPSQLFSPKPGLLNTTTLSCGQDVVTVRSYKRESGTETKPREVKSAHMIQDDTEPGRGHPQHVETIRGNQGPERKHPQLVEQVQTAERFTGEGTQDIVGAEIPDAGDLNGDEGGSTLSLELTREFHKVAQDGLSHSASVSDCIRQDSSDGRVNTCAVSNTHSDTCQLQFQASATEHSSKEPGALNASGMLEKLDSKCGKISLSGLRKDATAADSSALMITVQQHGLHTSLSLKEDDMNATSKQPSEHVMTDLLGHVITVEPEIQARDEITGSGLPSKRKFESPSKIASLPAAPQCTSELDVLPRSEPTEKAPSVPLVLEVCEHVMQPTRAPAAPHVVHDLVPCTVKLVGQASTQATFEVVSEPVQSNCNPAEQISVQPSGEVNLEPVLQLTSKPALPATYGHCEIQQGTAVHIVAAEGESLGRGRPLSLASDLQLRLVENAQPTVMEPPQNTAVSSPPIMSGIKSLLVTKSQEVRPCFNCSTEDASDQVKAALLDNQQTDSSSHARPCPQGIISHENKGPAAVHSGIDQQSFCPTIVKEIEVLANPDTIVKEIEVLANPDTIVKEIEVLANPDTIVKEMEVLANPDTIVKEMEVLANPDTGNTAMKETTTMYDAVHTQTAEQGRIVIPSSEVCSETTSSSCCIAKRQRSAGNKRPADLDFPHFNPDAKQPRLLRGSATSCAPSLPTPCLVTAVEGHSCGSSPCKVDTLVQEVLTGHSNKRRHAEEMETLPAGKEGVPQALEVVGSSTEVLQGSTRLPLNSARGRIDNKNLAKGGGYSTCATGEEVLLIPLNPHFVPRDRHKVNVVTEGCHRGLEDRKQAIHVPEDYHDVKSRDAEQEVLELVHQPPAITAERESRRGDGSVLDALVKRGGLDLCENLEANRMSRKEDATMWSFVDTMPVLNMQRAPESLNKQRASDSLHVQKASDSLAKMGRAGNNEVHPHLASLSFGTSIHTKTIHTSIGVSIPHEASNTTIQHAGLEKPGPAASADTHVGNFQKLALPVTVPSSEAGTESLDTITRLQASQDSLDLEDEDKYWPIFDL